MLRTILVLDFIDVVGINGLADLSSRVTWASPGCSGGPGIGGTTRSAPTGRHRVPARIVRAFGTGPPTSPRCSGARPTTVARPDPPYAAYPISHPPRCHPRSVGARTVQDFGSDHPGHALQHAIPPLPLIPALGMLGSSVTS